MNSFGILDKLFSSTSEHCCGECQYWHRVESWQGNYGRCTRGVCGLLSILLPGGFIPYDRAACSHYVKRRGIDLGM